LLGVLVLGTGLGIGLGLSEAPSAPVYPKLPAKVIEAFNSYYHDEFLVTSSGLVHMRIEYAFSEHGMKVSRSEAVSTIDDACGASAARILSVTTVEAWLGGTGPTLDWAVNYDPPGPHMLLSTGPVGSAVPAANWYLGLISTTNPGRPFCVAGHFSKLPRLPVFGSARS
jgi:hypothetical protein